jgi:hypothetical protein
VVLWNMAGQCTKKRINDGLEQVKLFDMKEKTMLELQISSFIKWEIRCCSMSCDDLMNLQSQAPHIMLPTTNKSITL